MSGGESEGHKDGAFVENDASQTLLPYGDGGVPIYIAVAWVAFIVAYGTAIALLILPDLRAWMGQ